MAGPVSGISGQQNFPAATTFNPTQDSNDVREGQDVQPEEDTVQPQGAAAAESQNANTEDPNSEQLDAQLGGIEQFAGDEERGSLVDVLV